MDMADEWVPPAMTGEEYERLTAIETGFPDYVRGQINKWVEEASCPGGYFDPEVPAFLSRQLKTIFNQTYEKFSAQVGQMSDRELANVIDCMLFHELRSCDLVKLDQMLNESRAGWSMTRDEANRIRLTQTQPSGVVQAYEDVMNKTAKAGKLLAEAYESAYGVSTNPNHAYDLSVKAVETLACPAFLPKNNRATLGSVIIHLEKRTVSLPLLEKNANHRETLTKMMRLLWEGGTRHGEESYEHVSLPGARTAHALATCLVSMLHEDVITVE